MLLRLAVTPLITRFAGTAHHILVGQYYNQIRWEQSEGPTLPAASRNRSLCLLRVCGLQGASYLKAFVSDLVNGEVLAVFQASHELIAHLLVLLPNVLTEVYFVPANPPRNGSVENTQTSCKIYGKAR